MGSSDSLFRLFSSCRDKKGSVQACHRATNRDGKGTKPCAARELVARTRAADGRSPAPNRAPKELNTGTNRKEIVSSPGRASGNLRTHPGRSPSYAEDGILAGLQHGEQRHHTSPPEQC